MPTGDIIPARLTRVGVDDNRTVVAEFNAGGIVLSFDELQLASTLMGLAEAAGELPRSFDGVTRTPWSWPVEAVRHEVQSNGRDVMLQLQIEGGLRLSTTIPTVLLAKLVSELQSIPPGTSSASGVH